MVANEMVKWRASSTDWLQQKEKGTEDDEYDDDEKKWRWCLDAGMDACMQTIAWMNAATAATRRPLFQTPIRAKVTDAAAAGA